MRAELARLPWPVRTERLSLRPANSGDAGALWRYRRLPEVNQWLTSAPATAAEFRRHFLEPERLAKTLVIELDGVVIGDLMIAIEDAWSQSEVAEQAAGTQAELGWALAPEHAGRGYATEAVRALFDICFRRLGLRRVVAGCFADNVPSWRLMEKLGMRRETHSVRESLHRSGEWLDGYGYALLADEWDGA